MKRIERASEVWTKRTGIQVIVKSKGEWLLVAAIVALGTVFRLWSPKMGADLWYDEVFSLIIAQQPLGEMLHRLYLGGDTMPPLYTVLLHLWMKLGASDAHVKFLSLVFGVASIFAIYLLARQAAGKLAGVASCLLLAVSPLAIYYSIEARPYAIFLFFSLISNYFFVSAIQKDQVEEGDSSRLKMMPAGYWISTTLAIYSHWFGLLLPLTHAVGVIIYQPFSRRMIRRHILTLIGIGCCCLPLLPFLWKQIRLQAAVGESSWPGRPGLRSLFDIALLTTGGQSLLALTAAFFLIAYVGENHHTIQEKRVLKRNNIFFAAYTFLPVIAVYTTSMLTSHYMFFVPRYFLPFLVGLYVLVGLAASRIERKMAVVWVFVFGLVPLYEAAWYRRPPENQYSRIAAQLSLHDEPGVLIGHLSPASYYSILHYRRGSAATDKVLWDPVSGGGYLLGYNVGGEMLDQNDLVEVGTELRKYRELWIVADPIGADPETQALGEWLRNDEDFSLVSEERIGQVSLEHYRLKSAASTP